MADEVNPWVPGPIQPLPDVGAVVLPDVPSWVPVLAVQADGVRRVLAVTDWVDGTGAKPLTGFVGPAGLVPTRAQATDIRGAMGAKGNPGAKGDQGDQGNPGIDGWTPQWSVEEYDERRVMRILGWEGGEGTPPDVGYLGASGVVQDPAFAVDLRGGTGPQGDKGDVGDTGPANELSIGTVQSGATAAAFITGAAPQQVLDLTLPQGDPGPANSLSIGDVTVGDYADAQITGVAPQQVLDLTLPRAPKGDQGDKGDTGDTGAPGPANSLSIGTVVGGNMAKASITGEAPSQTLNLTLPKGEIGPANTLVIGTVQSGAQADASITGDAPNQTLNLTLPKGDPGEIQESDTSVTPSPNKIPKADGEGHIDPEWIEGWDEAVAAAGRVPDPAEEPDTSFLMTVDGALQFVPEPMGLDVNPARTIIYESCRRPVTVETSMLGQPASHGGLWEYFPPYGTPGYSALARWTPEGRVRLAGGREGDSNMRFYLVDKTFTSEKRRVEMVAGDAVQSSWGIHLCVAYLNESNFLYIFTALGAVKLRAVIDGVGTDLASFGTTQNLSYYDSANIRRVWAGVYNNHGNGSPSSRHVAFGVEDSEMLRWPMTTEISDLFFRTAPTRVGVGVNASTAYLYNFRCDLTSS